jgi:hypothetical protein
VGLKSAALFQPGGVGYIPIVSGSAASNPPEASSTPAAEPSAGEQLTPAMRQYWEQKRQAGEALLLFRMGDFYEMFYDDAKAAAKLLGIALTSRDRGKTPLAGIPHHALDGYLAKLVAAGRRVAISEQIQDPRQAKGVVDRAIVRIVTPGTLTDEGLLDQQQSNVLAAVFPEHDQAGIATLELSTRKAGSPGQVRWTRSCASGRERRSPIARRPTLARTAPNNF